MTQTLSIPDFDCYPVTRTLSGVRIADGDVQAHWTMVAPASCPACGCGNSARTWAPFTR